MLDSHYCLWLTLRRNRLSTSELEIIVSPDNEIAFSSVSIWELRIKWDGRFVSGERKIEANPQDVLDGLRAVSLAAVDLTPELAVSPLQAAIPHRDPFDALLLTLAQETGRKLFTRDEKLRGHPLAFHAD